MADRMNRMKQSKRQGAGMSREKYIRVLPSFVMDLILVGTLEVARVYTPQIEDFGLVENVMMKAQDFFIFAITGLGCWSHDECCKGKTEDCTALEEDGASTSKQAGVRSVRQKFRLDR